MRSVDTLKHNLSSGFNVDGCIRDVIAVVKPTIGKASVAVPLI